MELKIRKAAVLGAGVMGAQIAAHLAAAGVRTYLLDLSANEPPKDPKMAKAIGKNFRNAPALVAIENLKKLKPSPLTSKSILANIIPGNFDDDMSVLAECDWIVEAVVERLDIKKSMLSKIAEYARPEVPVTTNTSGLSMASMAEDMPEHFTNKFFGTHFFNPPRYMKLLEIIPHHNSDMELVHSLASWIEANLGKGIVYTNDTINFIGNRIGVFTMMATLRHMDELGLNIETVDALTGKLMGRPASATLRTMDVVGIDIFSHVAENVYKYDQKDPYREWFMSPEWIKNLIAKGHLGQKAGSKGAYMKSKDERGKTKILVYRPSTDTYEDQAPQMFDWMKAAKKEPSTLKRLDMIIDQKDVGAEFIWRVLRDTMAYSAVLLEEIANFEPLSLDNAIKWGFNWEWGPFQIWQALGFDKVHNRMKAEGIELPSWVQSGISFYRPEPDSTAWKLGGVEAQYNGGKKDFDLVKKADYKYFLPQSENKDDPRTIISNRSASLIDLGDGVACLNFHSKMNAINTEIVELTLKAIDIVSKDFKGLVIGNDAEVFSAGANLMEIVTAIKADKYEDIDKLLRSFQGAMQLIKYAPFPSVSAPQGLTLGGGCEFSLHASKQILANDTFAGLVEVGVGLIPAGGGTKELALRAYDYAKQGQNADPMPFLQKAFMLIGMAQTSTSGLEAVEMGLYPQDATISISRDHQIDRAKKLVVQMADNAYIPPIPKTKIKVAGDIGIHTFKMMLHNMVEGKQVSEYDAFIGEKVATVLCGGEIDAGTIVDEQYFLDLERRIFLELCRNEKTQARIEHMLTKGKPLRN